MENNEKVNNKNKPVEPVLERDVDGILGWTCGSCGAFVYHIYDSEKPAEQYENAKLYAKYCRLCGKPIKW